MILLLLGNELEVTGNVRNLSPTLWTLSQLTILYLNDNQLTRLPSEIACLTNLVTLDLSNNKLRNLPAEIGTNIDRFLIVVYFLRKYLNNYLHKG